MTASIADDVAVGGVTLQVVDPSGATVSNATMTCDPTWRCTDTRAYGVAGTWVVRVWAADRSGNLASASTTIAIVPGADPVANAGPDVSIDAGATLTFNGSLSIDDYGIVAYEWTFTSEAVVRSLTGPTPRFRFDVPGTYVVTLTVRDVAGHADTDTVTVTVLAASPPPAETPFWYYAAAGLVLLFVVALVLGWIVRRHRAQQIAARRRELEAAEAEREAKRAARDAQARMPDEDEL